MSQPVPFEYAVVRAVPRMDRGESVNIAVILYCQARDFLGCSGELKPDRILALDPSTGEMRWHQHRTPAMGMEVAGYSGLALYRDKLYSGFSDGTVIAFALWNPADLGYLAAYAAKALIEGTITGAEGDEFEAGKLGSYKVGKDATVLLGDPYVFNKDNIEDFHF